MNARAIKRRMSKKVGTFFGPRKFVTFVVPADVYPESVPHFAEPGARKKWVDKWVHGLDDLPDEIPELVSRILIASNHAKAVYVDFKDGFVEIICSFKDRRLGIDRFVNKARTIVRRSKKLGNPIRLRFG